jgi:hypothetical protein
VAEETSRLVLNAVQLGRLPGRSECSEWGGGIDILTTKQTTA